MDFIHKYVCTYYIYIYIFTIIYIFQNTFSVLISGSAECQDTPQASHEPLVLGPKAGPALRHPQIMVILYSCFSELNMERWSYHLDHHIQNKLNLCFLVFEDYVEKI